MSNKKLIAAALSSKIGWNLFFESDSSDAEDEVQHSNPRNMGYFENTICLLNNQQFKVHFRMIPNTFENLYQQIAYLDSKYVDVIRGHPKIPLEKQVLPTVWYLANTECFRSVSDRFGISIIACWNVMFDISKQILKLNFQKKIITWPSTEKALETSNFFKNKTKFPGIIGCIDGSHIDIPAPKEYASSYVNRKKYHSVLLQAVCDENLKFIDCYTGEAGSIHDSCLFRRSPLYAKINNGSLTIPDQQHLLGDLGYSLKNYLLTPFKNTGNLISTNNFARLTIERAFALVKGRFSRLTGLSIRRPDIIPLLIMAACILHKICLENGDVLLIDFIVYPDDGSSDPASYYTDRPGSIKRNQILRILNN